jgi:hypothetical protein
VPFPAAAGKWQVSSSGGLVSWWKADGTELYYLTPDLKLIAVEVNGKGADFVVGAAHPLLAGRSLNNAQGGTITPDGKRILLALRQGESAAPITLVTNWAAGLKK